jgi:hypothetical protein
MAPPGYTGRDKRDFLDKAGKYLEHCHAAVTPARAAEVAQQLDQYRAALPAGQRWRLGMGECGTKARLQLASALESLSTMVQHKHGRHHSSKKFVLLTEGFEVTHLAQTTRVLADCGASVNLVHNKTILQMGGQIDYNGVKFKFTKCASQELGGSIGPCVPGTCALPLVNSDGTMVPLPLGADDHACTMSGMGGAQSLFAVGSDGWLGGEHRFLTVLTRLGDTLLSATIDNTATAAKPSNVSPLPMGPE